MADDSVAELHPENQPASRQADIVSAEYREPGFIAGSWSGPLPPPATLQQYENTLPGSADRILSMAEHQMEHRQQLDKAIVGNNFKMGYFGLVAGFILSAMIVAGSIYLIAQGHDWAGSSLIGVNLVSLAAVFVYGSRSRRAARGRAVPGASRPGGPVGQSVPPS